MAPKRLTASLAAVAWAPSVVRNTKTSRGLSTPQSRAPSPSAQPSSPPSTASNADLPVATTPAKVRERQDERDFFMNVLGATTTKRDANAYLKRFKNAAPAATDNPMTSSVEPMHLALVLLRSLASLPEDVIVGMCTTLSQLHRLGLHPVVILDDDQTGIDAFGKLSVSAAAKSLDHRHALADYADRLALRFREHTRSDACRVDNTLAVSVDDSNTGHTEVRLQWRGLILSTLQRGMIPIICPFAHTVDTQQVVSVNANDVLLGLARELTRSATQKDESLCASSARVSPTVDRVIVLDPLGGIPSLSRPDKAHIFINLRQEYPDIKAELESTFQPSRDRQAHRRHLANLDLLNRALSILPAASSALITSPGEAAIMNDSNELQSLHSRAQIGVRTRTPRNPLIFNLLTDKPIISSSLPVGRLNSMDAEKLGEISHTCPATFVKWGMPVTMIPDPRLCPWKPPDSQSALMNLDDSQIDLSRLVALIEDSFDRPLDLEGYMKRIHNRLAGIIVAGDYEGGAILTWELPAGVSDDGSKQSRSRMVPYLDKFAVRKRSQGAGGVADVVFSAMVRTCFPNGVCWRSRKNNPVNKWYFERSVGSLKIPSTQWTMFWTDPSLETNRQRWLDYYHVCKEIQPNWADRHKPAD